MANRKPPDVHDPVRTDASHIGDELALRASLDPAWDAVLAAWLAGRGWEPCER